MLSKQNTPGVGGIEYEILVPAYFALKLNNNKDVKDFSIRSNVATFGNMDDVIVDITLQNDDTLNFAFQLKHIENESKKLLPTNFETKGNFSLEKYCKAFKGLDEEIREKYHFVLYTNSEFDKNRTNEVRNFSMSEIESCPGQIFFDTSLKKSVYKFEVNDKTPNATDVTKSDYESFLPKLTLHVCQKNFKDLKDDIEDVLKHKDAVLKYIELFRKWHEGSFTNKTIDRKTVNIHLVDIFLSPWLITDYWFSEGKNRNLDLFFKTVDEFDVTIIDERRENFVNHMEKTEDMKDVERTNFLRLAHDYKIIEKKEQEIDEKTKLKIYLLIFQKRVILDFNELSKDLIYRALELYQIQEDKIKIIILGNEVDSSRIKNLEIFQNLTDVSSKNNELYQELLKHEISLQGRNPVSLQQLINTYDDTSSFFGVKEVYEVLLGNMTIGEERATLPPNYISRKISAVVSDLNMMLKKIKEGVAAINFCGRLAKFESTFEKENIAVVDVEQYLQQKDPKSSSLIISLNGDSAELIGKILEKSNQVSFFKMLNDSGCLLHLKTLYYEPDGVLCNVRTKITDEVAHSVFTGPLNVLVADAGMGKSTVLKYLRNECPWKFWTIDVDLKAHYSFFGEQHTRDEFLDYIMETVEDTFLIKLRQMFRQERKIMFFLDGLDELPGACLENALQLINDLTIDGFHIWLSSRETLEHKICTSFNTFSINIVPLSDENQEKYVQQRLQSQYSDKEIRSITTQVFKNTDILKDHQFLSVPLQLYMLTTFFLDNRSVIEEINESFFVLSKMYTNFFEGRYRHCIEKLKCGNSGRFVYSLDDFLELYEILALETVFHSDVYSKLKLDSNRSKRFLNVIKTEGDPLGIVTKIDKEKALFKHHTYAEYFACTYLMKNFRLARELRQVLLSENYKYLMLMLNVLLAEDNPLHLAIIYRNIPQIEKYMDSEKIYDKGGRNPLHLAVGLPSRGWVPLRVDVNRKYSVWGRMISYFQPWRERGPPHMNENLLNKYNEIIKKLVAKFNPHECDQLFGKDAFYYAILQKNLFASETILESHGMTHAGYCDLKENDFISPTVAYHSTIWGYENLLSLALQRRNSNIVRMTEEETQENLLHLAAAKNNIRIASLLIDYGIPIDESCKYRSNGNIDTPLAVAVEMKNTEMIDFLLERGSDLNFLTNQDLIQLVDVCHRFDILEERINESDKVADIFFQAVAFGNTKIAQFFLERNIDVNAGNSSGILPIHQAVWENQYDMAKFLLQNKANVMLPCNGNTALHLACLRGNYEMVLLLLEHGAETDAMTPHKQSTLHYAVQGGNVDIVKLLLTKNPDLNAKNDDQLTPLLIAAQNKSWVLVELLLGHKETQITKDMYKMSVFHYAVKSGNYEILDLLLERVTHMDSLNEDISLLGVACDAKMVEYLLEKFPECSWFSFESSNKIWDRLLSPPINSNTYRVIELMLSIGADPNFPNGYYISPLAHAIRLKHFKLASLLVDYGAEINEYVVHAGIRNEACLRFLLEKGVQLNDFKDTIDKVLQSTLNTTIIDILLDNNVEIDLDQILMNLLRFGDFKTIKKYIEKGADVNAKTKNGKTILFTTVSSVFSPSSKTDSKVKFLLSNGADINCVSENNETIWRYLFKNLHLETLEFILNECENADLNITDGNGHTPLFYAVCKGYHQLVKLLLDKGARVNDSQAFEKAVEKNDLCSVKLFFEHGFQINDETDHSIIMPAAGSTGDCDIIDLLLKKGFKIDAASWSSETALSEATRNGHFNAVKFLLLKGAKHTIDGKTVWDYLPGYNKSLIDLFIKKNVEIDERTRKNLLNLAVKNEDSDLVAFLLNCPDPETFDLDELTASELSSNNNQDVFQVLKVENECSRKEKLGNKLWEQYTSSNEFTDDCHYILLHLTVYLGMSRSVEVMVQDGLDLESVDVYNPIFPLHFAVKDGVFKPIELMKVTERIAKKYVEKKVWKISDMQAYVLTRFPMDEQSQRRKHKFSYLSKNVLSTVLEAESEIMNKTTTKKQDSTKSDLPRELRELMTALSEPSDSEGYRRSPSTEFLF